MISLLSDPVEQMLTPQTILNMNYTFVHIAILVISVRLSLFTHLTKQALIPIELAVYADTMSELAERLLQKLEVLGLVVRIGDAYYFPPVANLFLVEEKPSYLSSDTRKEEEV